MLNVISILFGAMIGSCLNVFICRLPKEESIVSPGSHCPSATNRSGGTTTFLWSVFCCCEENADTVIDRSRYNILWSRGHRTPLASVIHHFGLSLNYVIYFSFAAALVVITMIDLHHQIIPDMISLPGIGVGLLASWILPRDVCCEGPAGTAAPGRPFSRGDGV